MKTHEQTSAGPDEPTRALTKHLADLAKADGVRFAAVVRQADAAVAAGASRDEALQASLDGTLTE